jgi:hypothetical protein
MPTAIEEVLRYRSPVQWMMRTPRRDVELHGQAIHAGQPVLAMIGSANRDPCQFCDAGRFDISRDPNPHVAFGHGIHFCLGAALSRLESKIAVADLLERFKNFELGANEPWQPREALKRAWPGTLTHPLRGESRRCHPGLRHRTSHTPKTNSSHPFPPDSKPLTAPTHDLRPVTPSPSWYRETGKSRIYRATPG